MRSILIAVVVSCFATIAGADLAYIEQPRDPDGRGDASLTLSEMMKRYGVPGISVAVIRDFAVADAEAFGRINAATDEPLTPHTRFQAASISKPIAALAVLRAAQEGKLDLDADINTLLKSWQLPENGFTATIKVTPAMLLSHTGGTTVNGFPGYAKSDIVPTVVQLLSGEGNTDAVIVDLEPGSQWRYSGGGTTVMQLALSDVLGASYPDILWESVLQPLGMTESCYCQPPPDDMAPFAARAHDRDGKPFDGNWHVYPELAAAGLWTTPTDLCKAAADVQRALRGDDDRLLTPEFAKLMVTPRAVGSYGLGFALSRKGGDENIYFEHGGSNAGFKCHLTAHLTDGYGAAVMANGEVGIRIVTEVLRRIAAHDGWEGRW